jgi:hypothetical protein
MKRTRETGNVLVLTVIGMTVLLGAAGLAVDVGALRHDRRLQQSAADAAAIAGASNIAYTGVTAGAKAASATNGFTDGVNNVTVTVNNPPVTGPHTGDSNYVEALVAAVQPTYFMRIFGITTANVSTRAVATNTGGGNSSGCLYTLGAPSSSIEGVNINGSAILNATTCGIVDNGNFNTKGNKLIVNAGTFGVAGDWNSSGPGGTVTCAQSATCPATGMPASGNPFTYLTPPCNPCTGGTKWSGGGNITPGTYSEITVGNGSLNMAPGTYIVTGSNGMSVGGNGSITANGVTIYFSKAGSSGDTFTATGTPNINMTPPPAGQAYAGILMYQNPLDTSGPQLGGNTGANYGGVLYFPSAQVTFYGNNTTMSTGIVVADALALSGNPTVNLQGQAGLPTGVNVVKTAVLVE